MLPIREHFLSLHVMIVIAVKTLRQFAKKKKDAEQPLLAWYQEVCKAYRNNHNELKVQIRNASVINNKRVVFNIHGNKFRLVVDIEYRLQIIFIVWAGTQAEYDHVDVKKLVYVKTS